MNTKAKRSTKSTSKPKTGTQASDRGDTREEMIAEAAYLRAAARDFQGNDCLGDWLEAEKEVDAQLAEKSKSRTK